jgi:iron complex outermembrane receptor protein
LKYFVTNSEDSFGYELQHLISAREDNFDVTASFSIATTGAFYDAEGDRIPLFELGGDSSTTLNGLLKFGVDLTPKQRLQLTFNHFDDSQEPDVISILLLMSFQVRKKPCH